MKHNTQHPQDNRTEGQLKSDYAEYVYAKAEIHENPLPFDHWLELEKEAYKDFVQPQESKEPPTETHEYLDHPDGGFASEEIHHPDCPANDGFGCHCDELENAVAKEPLGITPDPDELQLLADSLFAKKEELITAYDNTYRKGYNPTQVDALYKALGIFIHAVEHEGVVEGRVSGAVKNAKQALKNAKL